MIDEEIDKACANEWHSTGKRVISKQFPNLDLGLAVRVFRLAFHLGAEFAYANASTVTKEEPDQRKRDSEPP